MNFQPPRHQGTKLLEESAAGMIKPQMNTDKRRLILMLSKICVNPRLSVVKNNLLRCARRFLLPWNLGGFIERKTS